MSEPGAIEPLSINEVTSALAAAIADAGVGPTTELHVGGEMYEQLVLSVDWQGRPLLPDARTFLGLPLVRDASLPGYGFEVHA